MAVLRDMHGFHVAVRGQHHLDLGRLEHAAIFFVVAILHLDIGLGEEAENLREQIAFMVADLLRPVAAILAQRSEEHTSELQSLMRTSYAVFCLKKKRHTN